MRLRYTRPAVVVAVGVLPGLSLIGCGSSSKSSTTTVITTRQQTIHPVAVADSAPHITPSDVAHYATYGYSAYQTGPGEDQGRKLDLLPGGYTPASSSAKLLSFFSMSDIHITDKESPAEGLVFGWTAPYQAGGLFSQAYSPVCLSTTQVLDAAVKTINAVHRQTPLDFGLVLGDVANSSQTNELRWFIDVMDGKSITPSSGDHRGAETIGYQKPFQATGLAASLPWYEAIGNHDQYFMGIGLVTDKVRAAQVGTAVLNMGPNVLGMGATEGTGVYVGVVDGATPLGDVILGGPAASFTTPPTVVADPNRLSVTTDPTSPTGYTGEFFSSTSAPAGHGFSRSATGSTAACYTFTPKAGLPLRVIVLDDTCKSSSPTAGPQFYGGGWVDDARLAWLTAELQKGQDAGELMILACHIPINPQKDLTDSTIVPQFAAQSPHTEAELLTTLHQYPNLVMVMAGHRHLNVVTPQPSPDATHPEYGFWEVETSSLRDFPRNFRTFELHRNHDNTISVVTTDVDPQVTAGTPAADSLGYAVGAMRLFGNTTPSDTSSHVYNAELVKPLTAAMQTKIAGYGARSARP